MFADDDSKAIKQFIGEKFAAWNSGFTGNAKTLNLYSREQTASKLSELLSKG